MNDTEMLDWVQHNITMLRENLNEEFVMTWIDKDGMQRETVGKSLRDCVRGAAFIMFHEKTY